MGGLQQIVCARFMYPNECDMMEAMVSYWMYSACHSCLLTIWCTQCQMWCTQCQTWWDSALEHKHPGTWDVLPLQRHDFPCGRVLRSVSHLPPWHCELANDAHKNAAVHFCSEYIITCTVLLLVIKRPLWSTNLGIKTIYTSSGKESEHDTSDPSCVLSNSPSLAVRLKWTLSTKETCGISAFCYSMHSRTHASHGSFQSLTSQNLSSPLWSTTICTQK